MLGSLEWARWKCVIREYIPLLNDHHCSLTFNSVNLKYKFLLTFCKQMPNTIKEQTLCIAVLCLSQSRKWSDIIDLQLVCSKL